MLVKFPPIFVADTKVIDGYNFAATLMFGEKFRNIIFRSSGGVWVTIYVLQKTFRRIIVYRINLKIF